MYREGVVARHQCQRRTITMQSLVRVAKVATPKMCRKFRWRRKPAALGYELVSFCHDLTVPQREMVRDVLLVYRDEIHDRLADSRIRHPDLRAVSRSRPLE